MVVVWQSLMLSIAKSILEEEERERERERERYMAENCPPVSMPRSMQELQVCPVMNGELVVQCVYHVIIVTCFCSGAVQRDSPQGRVH